MNKLFKRLFFHNDATPALNETNLNIISKAIDDIDDRVVEIADDVIESVPVLLKLAETVEPNAEKAEKAAEDAQEYAHEAAIGSGGNALEYISNKLKLKRGEEVLSEVTIQGGGGGGGTSDYNDLNNKPTLDGTTIEGNMTSDGLGLATTELLETVSSNIMGSDAYNPSTSYAENDTCIDENALWKCLVPCSGIKPSTDDGTHWEKVTLSQINNDLTDKIADLTTISSGSIFSNLKAQWSAITDGNAYWYKCGKIVMVAIMLKCSSAINTGEVVIPTMPTGPSGSTYGIMGNNNNANGNFFVAGKRIGLRIPASSSTWICGQVIYFTSD